jgi:Phosphodiester glycosidase
MRPKPSPDSPAFGAACAAIALSTQTARSAGEVREPGWQVLEEGLELQQFLAPVPSAEGDSRIAVLRIEPARFKLAVLSANAMKPGGPKTISAWTGEHHLVAAINGGMFEPGGASVGYGRVGSTLLNPAWKAKYGALLALDPANPGLAAPAILDADCEDPKALEPQYGTVLQSMRMIGCKGENLWQKSERKWSAAALGTDGRGRVLFIHARAAWDMHDFAGNLQKLPLGIARAMYLEGGPEASLSVRAGGVSLDAVGSYETGFNENGDNTRQWELPIVIGATRIEAGRQ